MHPVPAEAVPYSLRLRCQLPSQRDVVWRDGRAIGELGTRKGIVASHSVAAKVMGSSPSSEWRGGPDLLGS